ncbi:MAG: hypothetical protein JW714_03215, partial [Candidatus Omnitrophica bacterium]|nr:hypothetical protein [Candidatus Omnitrophota bacterium]
IDGGYALMEIDGVYLDSDNPNWASESQSRWQGTVQSAVHGVTRLAAPQVRSIQDDGYYANEAGLKITNDTVMEGENQLVNGVHMPAGTITTTESFYNNREGKTVKMTEIDLRKLAGYDGTETPGALPNFPPHLPDNGLLYASRDDAGELFQPGIRLANGALIDKEGGLTVVTEDPLYIQGDYNTDTKKPAAVICDALNILANGWQDTDSGVGLSNAARKAQETTINTAFIAGIDTSDPETGKYNGGLENYPRLHENWSNVNLNINGAFLALWDSAIAQGEWHYGSPGSGDSWLAQYTAPRRIWNYDPIFNNPLTLPPLTPWAVQIQRVAWWKE